MLNTIKSHLHPLGGRIIFWNLLLLLVVKLVLPQSALQFASFINSIPVFDSREVIQFTNEYRASINLPALAANSKLDLAASEKLTDMATQEYFAHVSPSGITPWFWIKKSQYPYAVAGENLAIGFFTAKDTVQAWLNSPSHKANIVSTKYKEIGVAVKAVEINGQNGLLVVQMFGSQNIQTVQTVQPTPAPVSPVTVTPVTTPKLALASPVSTPSGQTQGESITVQYVSTDEKTEPIAAPVTVKFEDAEEVRKVSGILNNIFSIYFFAIAGFSAFFFFLYERNKNMALKMSFNAALFILSVVIPAAKLTFEGLIF